MNAEEKNSYAGALISLGVAILFWASVPMLLKYFTHIVDAWTMNGLRYGFAAIFWLPYVVRPLDEVPPGRNIWKDAWPPAAAHMIGQLLFGLGPYFNDATVINFVSRSSFLFVTLFGFTLLADERPLARHPMFWIGFVATVAGLSFMFAGGLGAKNTCGAGMLILLGTSACWGLYSVLVRKFLGGYDVRLSFGVMSLYASPGLLALMFSVGHWHAALHMSLWHWLLVWMSAVAGIALGHVLFYRAIHTLGPIASEGSLVLIPLTTALLAFWILGERMTRLQWLGGLILIVGCLALLMAKTRIARRETALVTSTTD